MSLRLSFTVASIRAIVQGRNLIASVVAGFFIKLLDLFHTATVSDALSKLLSKSLTEVAGGSDNKTLAVLKALPDTADAGDLVTIDASKLLTDSAAAFDLVTIDGFKILTDSYIVSELSQVALVKILADGVSVTDDIDGATTTEDDQEISFFKVLTDRSNAGDAHIKSTDKTTADEAAAIDAGLLSSQNYTVDTTYFAEDYVGQSRIIT